MNACTRTLAMVLTFGSIALGQSSPPTSSDIKASIEETRRLIDEATYCIEMSAGLSQAEQIEAGTKVLATLPALLERMMQHTEQLRTLQEQLAAAATPPPTSVVVLAPPATPSAPLTPAEMVSRLRDPSSSEFKQFAYLFGDDRTPQWNPQTETIINPRTDERTWLDYSNVGSGAPPTLPSFEQWSREAYVLKLPKEALTAQNWELFCDWFGALVEVGIIKPYRPIPYQRQ